MSARRPRGADASEARAAERRAAASPRSELAAWAGLWALAIAVTDLVLLAWVVPEEFDAALVASLGGQAALQLAGAGGVLAALWGLTQGVAMRLPSTRGPAQRLLTGLLIALGALVLDHIAFRGVGRHWTLPLIRTAGLAASALLVAAYVAAPALFERVRPWHRLLCGLGLAAIPVAGLVFGTSFLAVTPKYLRESIGVMVVLPMQLGWVLLCAFSVGRAALRPARPVAIGVMCFLAAATLAPLLSERSRYVLVTGLEATRALRSWNRNVASLAPLGPLARFAGVRPPLDFPPYADDPDVSCRRGGPARARSALLISIDALRSDLYGLSLDELPVLARFRGEALDFVNAYQPSSGTEGSFIGMKTGRYFVAPGPRRTILPVLGEGLDLHAAWVPLRRVEPPPAFTDRVLEALDIAVGAGRAFVVHAHYIHLHLPYGTARAGHEYRPVLHEIDSEIGRVIDYLRKKGVLDETVVVITGDHGEELSDERGYYSHGYALPQTVAHTPLWLRMQGLAPGRREEAVSGVDVLPTFLDALGAECRYAVHGRSLLAPSGGDRAIFASSTQPTPMRPEDRGRYGVIDAVLCPPWKLLLDRGENALALFDVAADPRETRNLADRQPARVAALRDLLDAYKGGGLPEYPAGGRPGAALGCAAVRTASGDGR